MLIKKSEIFLVPNLLTILRLILLPFIFFFLFKNTTKDLIYAIILMGIVYFSDVFDGYLARKLNQKSDFGKILDPIVDKIVIFCFSLYVLFYKGFPLWAFVLILIKDISILSGGLYLIKKKNIIPTPNFWGKYTASVLGVVLFLYILEIDSLKILGLWIGVGMVLVTIFTYVKLFIHSMQKS